MPEAFGAALATPGLGWLALILLLAGLVRGFTGFGTALIFMPAASALLSLPVAVAVLAVIDLIAQPLIVPRALREADRREVAVLGLAALLSVPLGVWLLGRVDDSALRWGVALVATLTLAALVSGWRYRGRVGRAGLAGIGAAAGITGGATGLAGPPVILFYLAGQAEAAQVRANTILFLAAVDIVILANLLLAGLVGTADIARALLLVLPYGAGLLAGQRLFRPERERAFRVLAYLVIALAIVTGLPIFG